jgi:molybdenum cofactor cytidylyltransferase
MVFFHATIIAMNATSLPRLHVVILAAGFSTRLGRPKALVCVQGATLLRRTLTLAARVSPARIIVVLPPRAARNRIEAQGFNATFVSNLQRASGLSSSVRRGIAQARFSPAVLLLPVDMAILQHREVARLISRWRGARRRVIARRIGPQGGAFHGGIPLILPRWLYSRASAVTGDTGLRDLVGELPVQQRVLLDLPSAALDVDTRRELHIARQRLRRTRVSP